MLRNLVSTGLVIAAALLIGFHPHAGVGGWLAVAGLLLWWSAAAAIGCAGAAALFRARSR